MPVLELHGVSNYFGAIHALSEVDLPIEPGEVVGLIGDNGAGKSTFVKVIAGNFPPRTARYGSPARASISTSRWKCAKGRRSGLQDLALPNNLCAAANVFLGREVKKRVLPVPLLDHKAMARTRQLFTELKSETRPRDLVRQMSGGQRQAVAIARTRFSKAKIVLMDEPTAAIPVRQVAEVLDLIRRLRDPGIAIILIAPHARRVLGLRARRR